MEEQRKIKDLKKGDRIRTADGHAAQVISLENNFLFYYLEKTGEFLTKLVNINNYVILAR